MKLSPLDIRHMEFERGAVGYQRRQVRDFLDRVGHETESLLAEVQGLRQQVAIQAGQIEELKTAEAQLKRAVISAERIGNEMKEQARREADLVLRKARQERLDVLREAAVQLDAARAELTRLEHAQALVREQLRGQLTAFLSALDAKPTRRSLQARDDGVEDVIAALKSTVEAARREMLPGIGDDGQSAGVSGSGRPVVAGPDAGPSDDSPDDSPDAPLPSSLAPDPDSVDTTVAETDEDEEASAA